MQIANTLPVTEPIEMRLSPVICRQNDHFLYGPIIRNAIWIYPVGPTRKDRWNFNFLGKLLRQVVNVRTLRRGRRILIAFLIEVFHQHLFSFITKCLNGVSSFF